MIKFQDVGEFINDVKNMIEELNITVEDFAEIVNTYRSVSIVYDSSRHPTSVIIPIKNN